MYIDNMPNYSAEARLHYNPLSKKCTATKPLPFQIAHLAGMTFNLAVVVADSVWNAIERRKNNG